MSPVAGWLLVPILEALVLCGLGLLAGRAAGVRLPGAALPACGLAALIAVAGLLTISDVTAQLTGPVICLLAAGGLTTLLSRARRPDMRATAAPVFTALLVFAIVAAPSVLTGQASVAGYVKLDDSATWMGQTDWLFEHGRHVTGVDPSTYALVLERWLAAGYPTGSLLLPGIAATTTGLDLAAVYQPTIAVLAAVLALALYACARSLIGRPALAATAAVVAAQASLLLGYAQWGAIKELTTAPLLALLALLAIRCHAADGLRVLALLAIAAGATVGVLAVNGVVWAGPALVIGAVLAFASVGRPPLPAALGVAALLVLASLPALLSLQFLLQTTYEHGGVSAQDDFGNLLGALSPLQGAGLWPSGDFRTAPDPRWAAVLLAVGGLLAATLGLALAVRRRSWELPALLAILVLGLVPTLALGSPWIDAKGLAFASPMVLLATAVACAAGLTSARWRAAGAVGGVVLIAGCAWSTLAIARDVHVVPRADLTELRRLGGELAGRGPALVLDFQPYATRHLLRDADPEGASELRTRTVARASGGEFEPFAPAEVDDVATRALWDYRTIVRRRSPVAGRPPAAFRRIWAGARFEAWERAPAAAIPAHLPLTRGLLPAAEPDCARVRALARRPGIRTLAAAPGRRQIVADLAAGAMPPPWRDGAAVRPVVDGTGAVRVVLPRAGRWRVWIGGSVRGRLVVRIDGRTVGDVHHDIAYEGRWLRLTAPSLAAGSHLVQIEYRRGALPVGAGPPGQADAIGPLALTPAADDAPAAVVRLPAEQYRRLCDGRPYDWIEALR